MLVHLAVRSGVRVPCGMMSVKVCDYHLVSFHTDEDVFSLGVKASLEVFRACGWEIDV